MCEKDVGTESLSQASSAVQLVQGKIRKLVGVADNEDSVLNAVSQYAESRHIPLIAAKARLMPQLGLTEQELFEKELCEYLSQLDIPALMASEDENEISKTITTLKILYSEGFGDLIAIKCLYTPYPEYDPSMIQMIMDKWCSEKAAILTDAPTSIRNESNPFIDKTGFSEHEDVVLKSCLAGASKLLNQLKTDDVEAYNRAIKWCARAVHYMQRGIKFAHEYSVNGHIEGRLNCNDLTPMHQVLSNMDGNAILEPIHTDSHVALKVNGFDLVIDTYDGAIRSLDEFTSCQGYMDARPSYYYETTQGKYMANFNDEMDITSYEKQTKGSSAFNGLASILLSEGVAHEQMARHARSNSNQPDFSAAIATNSFVERLNPSEQSAGNLGIVLRDSGRLYEAQQVLEQCVETYPLCAHAWRSLGELYRSQSKVYEAITCFEKVLEIDPRRADMLDSIIGLLEANDMHAEAEQKIRLRLAKQSNDKHLQFKLRHSLLLQKKYVELEGLYRQILGKEPNNLGVLGDLAFVLNELGRAHDAKEILKQKHKMVPHDAVTLIRLAHTFSAISKGAALQYYAKLQEIMPSEWEIVKRILELYERGLVTNQQIVELFLQKEDYETAYMFVRKFSVDHIDDPTFMRQTADCLFNRGQESEAIALYEKVLEVEPENFNVLCDVASYYVSRDRSQAEALLERALVVKPDSKAVRSTKKEIARRYDQLD